MIMPTKQTTHNNFRQLSRVFAGVALGIITYYLAQQYASVDCGSLQNSIRAGGLISALKILGALTALLAMGIPAAIAGLVAGLLLGPAIGAPFASIAIVLTSTIFWSAGRLFDLNKNFQNFLDHRLAGAAWSEDILSGKAESGFEWVIKASMNAPVGYPSFALFVSRKIRHLSFFSLISGIFASSVLYVAGYALAGGSIGCAVVNHAQGFPIERYKTLMIISCLVLLSLSRVQIFIEKRGRHD